MAYCDRKKKFPSFKTALHYIKNARHLTNRSSLRPYKCQKCNRHHVGHDRGQAGVRLRTWGAVRQLHQKTKRDQRKPPFVDQSAEFG